MECVGVGIGVGEDSVPDSAHQSKAASSNRPISDKIRRRTGSLLDTTRDPVVFLPSVLLRIKGVDPGSEGTPKRGST